MPGAYLLYESAAGYGLFEVIDAEEIGASDAAVQSSITDLQRFSKMVKLSGFLPFTSAEDALAHIMNVSEGVLHEDLQSFLESTLPKVKEGKKAKFYLGVSAPNLGNAIQEATKFPCKSNETVLELLRGVRLHFPKFVKALDNGGIEKAQLGLGHSYSRSKVKFNVNRQDNMIIQSICLLDQLDKDINTCAMRVKEWYGWHFPELAKIVGDVFVYSRLVQLIGSRGTLKEEDGLLQKITDITLDEAVAQQILDASKLSMGMDVSEIDMLNITQFADKVSSLAKYRMQLQEYLKVKMSIVAPNLGALIGEPVAARLISHAGSLTNLAKCPASTVQILGAEKALFRALKSKGNTPKYGLIFHSSFIGRAGAKNKGRISRYLANKCSIAARIDSFSDEPNSAYGEKLKEQVEERLKFYDTGEAPRRNIDVMREVAASLGLGAGGDKMEEDGDDDAGAKKKKKKEKKEKKKKRKSDAMEVEEEAAEEKTPKKKKKKKKAAEEDAAAEEEEEESPKKKKKDKSAKKKKKKKAD